MKGIKMAKTKFILIISLFLIIGITSTVLNAEATNPEHFDLKYYEDDDILSIYIVHGVTDPTKHYVNYIEVQVGKLDETDPHHPTLINGTIVVTDTFTSQETYNINHFNYSVIAEGGDNSSDGDTIHVIATCNLGGYFEKNLYLFPTPAGHEFAFVTVVPAFIVGTLIASVFAVLPILLMKKNREVWMHKRAQTKS